MRDRIRWQCKKLLCALLYYGGIVAVYRCLRPNRRGAIFYFHQISRERFEPLVRYLTRRGHLVSLADLVRQLQGGGDLAPFTCVLTYDDGYESNYLENFPVIQEYRVPVTGFLSAGLIGTDEFFWWDKIIYAVGHTATASVTVGNRAFPLPSRRSLGRILWLLNTLSEKEKQAALTSLFDQLGVGFSQMPAGLRIMAWSQVAEMAAGGVDFGPHGLDHPILARLPLAEAERQIVESKRILEEKLDRPACHFAYPNGRAEDFNDAIKTAVAQAGFTCALTTIGGYVDSTSDRYALPRIPLEEDCSVAVLAARLAGILV